MCSTEAIESFYIFLYKSNDQRKQILKLKKKTTLSKRKRDDRGQHVAPWEGWMDEKNTLMQMPDARTHIWIMGFSPRGSFVHKLTGLTVCVTP